jgi:hypothetical protein
MNEEIECKTHPNAPHGFVRNASHTEDRYVCECEYWEESKVNERIKQLAEQATTRKFDGTGTDMGKLVLDQEKFAELIVKECAKVCDDLDIDDWEDKSFYDGTYYCYRAIKQHFGVEEILRKAQEK